MKILLIGGTGVLSSQIAKLAMDRGMNVTMVNRGHREIPSPAKVIISDKHDYSYITSQLQGIVFDAVIDFLCYTPDEVKQSFLAYSPFTKQYFFISSCAVYDKNGGGKKHVETDPKPLSIWKYSVNKWESEKALVEVAKNSSCAYTIVRPSITYGDTRIPYGIAPKYGYHWTLVARILADKPVIRWKEGKTRYNMMRVEDFAVGVVGLIGNPKAYNEDFNVCSDDTPTFNDVLDAISEVLDHRVNTVDITSEFYAKELPSRSGEILGGRSLDEMNSNDKIKHIVPDFMQTISLKEGVKMTIEAYKNQNYQRGIDWNFDADSDRIVRKWCRQNSIDAKQYNLSFNNYIGSARMIDRLTYYQVCYKDNPVWGG